MFVQHNHTLSDASETMNYLSHKPQHLILHEINTETTAVVEEQYHMKTIIAEEPYHENDKCAIIEINTV